jgi:hypothetical protein
MIRRIVYIGIGAAIGAYAVHRATKFTRRWKPQSLADALSEAREAVHDFAADVRLAAAEREAELREAFGLASDGDADHTTEQTVKEYR